MAFRKSSEEDSNLFECDRCHTKTTPDGFAYIGPADEANTSCSPHMAWKNICYPCATVEEIERWYGN